MNTTTRAIRFAPVLGYLVAMPESYDAAKVTAADICHDPAIVPARAVLAPLSAASYGAWLNCVATTDHDVAAADEARQGSADQWREALDACDRGDLPALRAALATARSLASEWGDSSQEDAALEMLDQ